MPFRNPALLIASLFLAAPAFADVAKHSTVTRNQGGQATEYTEMVADDSGNLRIELYGVDASGGRGSLRDFVVFRASELKMLSSSGGNCQAVSLDSDELPGGISRDEVMAAQAEAMAALEELRAQNPEMATMMEQQMQSMGIMMGDAEERRIELIETGEQREIGGYETKAFQVTGMPGMAGEYKVWAAEVGEVDGGRTMSAASAGMMRATQQMIRNMGMGDMFGNNLFAEVMEKMDDYYPILTENNGQLTTLISTDGQGSTDFNPPCN
jgi:hypothetical protein